MTKLALVFAILLTACGSRAYAPSTTILAAPFDPPAMTTDGYPITGTPSGSGGVLVP